MKDAIVYRRNDGWYLHSSSQTTDGVWIATQPFLKLPPDADLSAIGEAVMRAIDASRQSVPHPAAWNGLFQPMLQLAGAKSWATFVKGSMCLRFEADDCVLLVTPTKNLGPKEGHLPLSDKVLRLPRGSTDEGVGAAVQEAIALCE